MSDAIKHECGIALIRLKKPLEFYLEKYGTSFYGLRKMYLLMEKQHNRGQDGAGIANVKFDMPPGNKYINRERSADDKPIQAIFDRINGKLSEIEEKHPEKLKDLDWLKNNAPFTGELFLGHLRYGTFGFKGESYSHPLLRENNWMTRNLAVAGNFNLTNVDELFNHLVNLGQHPVEKADTITVLEKVGHFLDQENENLFKKYKDSGYSNIEIAAKIAKELDIQRILQQSAAKWDGGYAMAGLLGHGDAFVLRDPSGIRPAFWYEDDEVVVVTSERPAIQTVFDIDGDKVKEIKPGHALIIKKDGNVSERLVREPLEQKSCSFERIYFSRGGDKDIYTERKALGSLVSRNVLKELDGDIDNSVFSFIPNTAEVSFYGLMEGLNSALDQKKQEQIIALGDSLNEESLATILKQKIRSEKIAIKDAKLRTFITQDGDRDDLVAHVYDITYGSVRAHEDNLVLIDDSIVRGTTLKKSILRIMDRLQPKKVVVVSSAPQIRYPDCYGIDMAKLGDFIAFQAAIELLKENNMKHVIEEVYAKCMAQVQLPDAEVINYVKDIYAPFTDEQISAKISQLATPVGMNAKVSIIFQSIENLHKACPDHTGDWYFSGNYPTPGGKRVVNKAFINYFEGKNERAY